MVNFLLMKIKNFNIILIFNLVRGLAFYHQIVIMNHSKPGFVALGNSNNE